MKGIEASVPGIPKALLDEYDVEGVSYYADVVTEDDEGSPYIVRRTHVNFKNGKWLKFEMDQHLLETAKYPECFYASELIVAIIKAAKGSGE